MTTPTDTDAEATTLFLKYFEPFIGFFDAIFPSPCTVEVATKICTSGAGIMPYLAVREVARAKRALDSLSVVPKADSVTLKKEIRRKVAEKLSDQISTHNTALNSALGSRDEHDPNSYVKWATAELNVSAAMELWGRWPHA